MNAFFNKFSKTNKLCGPATRIKLFCVLRLKNIYLLSLISLLITLQSCDILNSDNKHVIDPPVYPSPYQDISISPDGQYLIFFRSKVISVYRDGTSNYIQDSTGIWKCKIDGTNLQLLFNSDWNSHSPQFIPQSQALLFNYGNQIVKAPYNDRLNKETEIVFLTDVATNNFYPTINSDGSIISYDSNFESLNGMYFIWVMMVDGTQKRRIAYDPQNGSIRMPSMYPSSDQIVHIRHIVGIDAPEIFKMDINGNNVKRITFNTKFDRRPRINFLNNRILFISDRKLFSVDTSGASISQLTDFDVQSACWTPDNEIIYVKYNAWEFSYNNGTIWIMQADGSNKKQLTYNYGLKLEGGD